MGKRGTTFCENAEPVSTISTPYERGTRFTVQVGFEMEFVDPAHQGQIVRRRHGLGAVDPRARQVQQRALAAHRQILAWPFDHRSSIRRAHRPGLLAKKSLSTVSWPILP